MRAESQSAFAALDISIDAVQRARWSQLEQVALQKRWEDPTAMDCFDVSLEKGAEKPMILSALLRLVSAPGRVERQVKLAEMEGAAGRAI